MTVTLAADLPKWKITLTANGRGARVERDGVPVRDVTAVAVSLSRVGEVPRVTLTMLAGSVEIEGPAAEVITNG